MSFVSSVRRLSKFKRVLLVTILSIFLLGILDVVGIPIWGNPGVKVYAGIFWTFAYTIAAVIAIVYFIQTRDKSEAWAIFLSFVILVKFGLQDLTFFVIHGVILKNGIPESMPHLFAHPVIGNVAKVLGLTTVTIQSLIFSVGLGIIITYFVVKWLRRI